MSDTTINEFHRVISRPRLDRFVSWSLRMEIFAGVVLLSEEVDILVPVVACRDPNDDMFLDVAVYGAADYLVSGDADLLALHPFRGLPILTPADFLAAVGPP
jgi:putative PIN family toxin of toxin-antitoxin system